MKETYGAREPESMRMRIACVAGGHSLTRAEPLNNIARTTLECFAVACAGVQSVFTAAFDEAFAIPTELSARTALRVQQIVAHETEVAATVDPLGGSYFVEALTDAMEQKIREVMRAVEDRGGFVEALESGWVQKEIARRAYEHQRAVEGGEVTVVGVNRFKTEEAPQVELHPPSKEAERERVEALGRVREQRDGRAVAQALEELETAAQGTKNLMPAIRAAVRAYATVGEIAGTLRKVFGRYRPPTAF